MTLIDRSRVLAYQRCPRERYLAYHLNRTGIQRKAKALPLCFGSAYHNGAEFMLQGDIETAVDAATAYVEKAFEDRAVGLDGEQPEDFERNFQYAKDEQAALAEALLRGWWAYEGESFLRTFEVIEVEREGRAVLQAEHIVQDDELLIAGEGDGLTLMFRPDALVRDRESGDLFIVSWKTCSSFTRRTVEQCKHDQQSISEVWGRVNEEQ